MRNKKPPAMQIQRSRNHRRVSDAGPCKYIGKYTAKIQRGPICGIFEREIGADDIRQTRKLKI